MMDRKVERKVDRKVDREAQGETVDKEEERVAKVSVVDRGRGRFE